MASPGLLFLLLVSSSLLPPTSSSDKERVRRSGGKIMNAIALLKDMAVPFLGLIGTHGELISAVVNLALGLITNSVEDKQLLNVIKSEFKSLNSKLDEYHAKTKWDIWSAAAFQKIEVNIKTAWDDFNLLVMSSDAAQKKTLTDNFINKYKEDSIKKLHVFLTSKENIFIENLSEMIKKKINCHENDVKMYSFMINALIFKGTVMNLFYYKQKNLIPKIDHSAKLAFESSSVMFKIHKDCMLKSMESVKIDVKKVTDPSKNTKKRQKLAHEVRLVLAESYSSYDWMVVAFKTRNSKHEVFKSLNKHVLLGFTEMPDEDITVAVARQAKGNHTMADKVRGAIGRCVTKSVECHQVKKALEACKERVDTFPVTQTYSAVHAFIDRPHDSYDAKEAPEEIFANSLTTSVPYIYKGVCKKYKVLSGEFIVLIKSDEDLKTKDPCSNMDCGGDQRGKCVRVKDAFVAVCECKQNYIGLKCEKSFEDYKKELETTLQAS